MPTVRDIVTRALQGARIVALGRDPKAKEIEYGLDALQSLYMGWVTSGMFGRLNDYLAESNHEAEEGQRIRHSSDYTVTLPTRIDGCDGWRQPYDLAVIETFNTTTSARSVKLWDRDQWVDLLNLTLDSEAPLAHMGMMGLAACLAQMLLPFGELPMGRVDQQAAQFKSALSLKFGSSRPERVSDYF